MPNSGVSGDNGICGNTTLLPFDLVCFSHLSWDFVYQRPQHLLSRCAQERRVFFIEEPRFVDGTYLDISQRQPNLWVIVPHLPEHIINDQEIDAYQRKFLLEIFSKYAIDTYALWYYTPMALSFSRHLTPVATIYDCMDELSAFQNAPPAMRQREAELFERADLVFTGGQSLYEVKRKQHSHVYAFPSSVDTAHFGRARTAQADPSDQACIPHPRLGFYGVIDERFDRELLDAVAKAQPDWQFVLIGPTAKIDPERLLRRQNIHYLGQKPYDELPTYLAGWDVAILPFAHNDSTRFISPTKTLEYLAGGKPVISTSIRDVVKPYGQQGLVSIADTPDEFIAATQKALSVDMPTYLSKVDAFLAQTSWDGTWSRMRDLIEKAVATNQALHRASHLQVSRQYVDAAASSTVSTSHFRTGGDS